MKLRHREVHFFIQQLFAFKFIQDDFILQNTRFNPRLTRPTIRTAPLTQFVFPPPSPTLSLFSLEYINSLDPLLFVGIHKFISALITKDIFNEEHKDIGHGITHGAYDSMITAINSSDRRTPLWCTCGLKGFLDYFIFYNKLLSHASSLLCVTIFVS